MKMIRAVVVIYTLFAIAGPAFSAPASFSGLTVTRIILKDEQGNPWLQSDQIEQLIGVKAGDTFSGQAIRSGLSLLYLKGSFRNIRVDGYREGDGVRLEYTFMPITIVDKIVVHGNSWLSTSVITDTLPHLEGKELREDKLLRIKEDLIAFYQGHGFFETFVSFRTEPLAESHHVALNMDIKEGVPTVIETINFVNNTVFKEHELLSVMKSRIGAPFDRDLLLDKDLEAVIKKFSDAGYPATKLGPVSVRFDNRKAFIRIDVSEGPRVSVRFTGNRKIGSSKLQQALLIWSEHDISGAAIDSSMDKIKTLYREKGYADVSVEVKKTEEPGRLDLNFIVHEGPRVLVKKIEITGNTAFASELIKKEMALRESSWYAASPFREDSLNGDVDNLRDRYSEAGYLSAEIQGKVIRSSDGRDAFVTLEITEGPRTTIGSITFEGNTVYTSNELLNKLSIKPGAPFNDRLVDDNKYRILSAYSNKGYLYARVDVEKTPLNGTVDIRYQISEDQIVRIGKIILRGNERTKDYVILRELLVKSGGPYDYEAMLASQQRIYHLGYFRLAKFEPIHPGEKEYVKDMLFTVEERPAGAMEYGVGYGNLDRFRWFVELSYRNLWGTARYASMRYEESDILKRAIFDYKEPWFLGQDLESKFSLLWSDSERLNSDTRQVYYSTRETSASFGIEKTYQKVKPSLTYQFENVVNYDVLQAAEVTPEDSGRVLVSSISPAVIWDLRDNIFNPRHGALFGVIFKEALRELGSEVDFSKMTLQASWFLPVGSSVLALSARAGVGWPFRNTAEIPLHERFYVGGSTTVRGFTQDAIGPSAKDANGNLIPQGGQSMAIFNIELRINPGEGFGFVLFTDAGNAWSGQELNLSDMRASYGAGIRYGTPIGPLRIDYGQKIHKLPGESPGEVHFNIGNMF